MQRRAGTARFGRRHEDCGDAVVLGTGNLDPCSHAWRGGETKANGSYCQSAWEDSTYANLSPDAAVALIGSGLTAADVVLRRGSLDTRGQILAITRGVLSNRHASYEPLKELAVTERRRPECVSCCTLCIRPSKRAGIGVR